jgi:hypothetical protein
MKHFNDYFKEFISCVKKIRGCPDFTAYQFIFEYQGKQCDNEQISDIKEVENKFNNLLIKGHSWINISYDRINENCLFVTFTVSKANYNEWVGKTKINLCGPSLNINGEFMWTGG